MSDLHKENIHLVMRQWVNDYSDGLYVWALHKITDEVVAQDLVQETFISAFQHFDSFQKASSPKTWLFSILKNKIVDHYRGMAKRSSLANSLNIDDETAQWFDGNGRWKSNYRPEPWDSDESLLDDPEFENALSGCISKLPESWSACVQLKYIGEKDTNQICQELNITASNLWQILHRAKMHLRNCLERSWFKA